jgi:membrane fusion protein, heavy metal efflux system
MNRNYTGVVIVSLGTFAVVAAFAGGVSRLSAPAKAETPAPAARETGIVRYAPGSPQLSALKVMGAEESPVPLAEPLNGRVAYDENATTRVTSPVAGRVVNLKVLPGDSVRAGDSLLVLDSPDLAQAVSDAAKAHADEIRKQRAEERARSLLDAGVIARKDFESADADFLQARAETERARLRLRNLGAGADSIEGARFSLRAPIAGVVADRQVNPGMEVRPDLQNPLFVITDPKRVWVIIDLPERNLSKVAVGNPVSVQVDAWPGEQFPGTIERIGEVVDSPTRRIPVRCAVANPDGKLKPEMYARIALLADKNRRAVRVPNSALITEGLYSYVFVEKEPGVFEKRRLRLGIQDREYSYVEDGLKPGERVVVVGPLLLNSELSAQG